jgi:hypothetical protein
MALSNLSKSDILIFYEIATRIWKFRGVKIQTELLNRIFKEGFERLEWTGAMPLKETEYFKALPEHLDFSSHSEVAQDYLEFLGRIDEFATECDSELARLDNERKELDRQRREAYQQALEIQKERQKIERVINAKKAYEEAEKRRQETYDYLREGDVSMFDLEFRITSKSATDDIARLMSQLARTTVVISPGNWGSAFHTSSHCDWLNKGRNRASKYTSVGSLITVGVEDAIYKYKKRPCHSCFMFWWEGEINPHPEFDEDEILDDDVIEIFLGDFATINQGAWEDFEVEVVDLLRHDKSHVKIKTHTLGRDIELVVPVEYLDFPEDIESVRREKVLKEQRDLEAKFRLENERLRTLEELILLLENGLKLLTQFQLRELLVSVEKRLDNLGLGEEQSLSLEYLHKRLARRIQEARIQIS